MVAVSGSEDTEVSVRNGVLTLTGTPGLAPGRRDDLTPIATRPMWDVEGPVGINDKLGEQSPTRRPQAEGGMSVPDQGEERPYRACGARV
ncbi:MAG TPA: hypothetical protein VIL16_04575 [Trebonia sp.]